MDGRTREVLEKYSRGDISASNAADALGVGYNVGDVYVLSREAGLPLPNSDGDFEAQQFDHAKKLFETSKGNQQRSAT